MNELLFWIVFNIFIILMLVLDLAVLHRHEHTIKFREALITSAVWVLLAVGFAVFVHFWLGRAKALEFVTGYLIEESLSIDNLFVFLLIFKYFRVPRQYQHKVLFWGILGALIMRGAFILAGIGLIRRFHWIIYVFGAFLIYTGVKLLRESDKEIHPEKNPVLRIFRSWMPMTKDFVNGKFFVRRPGLYATPLFVVLLVVETTDILFATDSVPAILAVSHDAFIVYTSNVFAILGLRSLYFALAGMMELFSYLHYGLASILMFIGVKMLISEYYKIPTGIALGVIAGVLAISILTSLMFPSKKALAAKSVNTNERSS